MNENQEYFAQIETGEFISLGMQASFDAACNASDLLIHHDTLWIYSLEGLKEHQSNINNALFNK